MVGGGEDGGGNGGVGGGNRGCDNGDNNFSFLNRSRNLLNLLLIQSTKLYLGSLIY